MEDQKKKRRKRGGPGRLILNLIMIAAAGVMIFAGVRIYQIQHGYKQGEDEYKKISDIAISIENKTDASGKEEERYRVDFDALWEINPEVVAWIRFIQPEIISYPVAQCDNNSKYLSKTFSGYDNTVGTIFVNCYNHPDFNDKNTIIYGHYMYNGTMFNDLDSYKDYDFWKENPYFYIYTPDGSEIRYHIYAAGVVKDSSDSYIYQFADDEAFRAFLENTKQISLYDTGVPVDQNSMIVTLSTCTKASNNDRFVVHAVKEEVKK